MDSTDYSIWNPLDYIEDFTPCKCLDLSEVFQFGRETATIANEQKVEIALAYAKTVGREVGDDRVDLNRFALPLCCTLMAQERIVHMVTSWPDTSIRRKSWNFCEVTGGPLTDPSQGFDHVRKDGDFSNLGFNDSVIFRILLDVRKGDGEDHSSTEPGKMSMLGSRLASPRRENRGMWMLASLFQDALLCTHKASEPKYLPPAMGGTGVTALFDNPNNVFLYVLAYRGGTYKRIYATACGELQEYLYRLERGVQSAPVLCPRLREKQDYFWGTYDQMVFVPKALTVSDQSPLPPPLYERTGGQNLYQNFENRLQRTRHVVTGKQAQVEWSHTRRLHSIFNGVFDSMNKFAEIDKESKRTLRARYDGALNANAALQNLLRREATKQDAIKLMGSDAFYTVTTGRREFTRSDADWVYLNGQGENYSLRDVSFSDDIFVREEVSAEETFKVGGIPLRPYFKSGQKLKRTKTKVGLYQISSTMEEWSEDLLQRLRTERERLGRPLRPQEVAPICMQDPEWVNDDTGLIGKCHSETANDKSSWQSVVLISDDRKLANKMAETCNVTVIRLSPRVFVKRALSLGLKINSETPTDFLKREFRNIEHVYKDTGSISAASVTMTEEDGIYYYRRVRETGWAGNARFSAVTLTVLKSDKLRKETHKPVTRPRIWRSGSRPYESVYSSHDSWSRSDKSRSTDWRARPQLPNRDTRKSWSGYNPSRQRSGGEFVLPH